MIKSENIIIENNKSLREFKSMFKNCNKNIDKKIIKKYISLKISNKDDDKDYKKYKNSPTTKKDNNKKIKRGVFFNKRKEKVKADSPTKKRYEKINDNYDKIMGVNEERKEKEELDKY